MGSIVDDRKEFTVLVTGFGPFREQYPVNPSWEIAKSLPAYLPPLRAKDVQARASTDVMGFPASGSEGVRPLPVVRIVVKPAEAIRVNYRGTRAVVPTLWDGDEREPDAVIHLGMGPTQPVYSIERRAHRTGYRTPDVDGELPEGENEAERNRNWIWYGCPDELDTDLDMGRILTQWRRISPAGLDLRMSDDPGRYLCDFIYYSSLAHLWKQQRRRRVTFLHVPVDASPRAVDLGRELVLNLVRCVAESELSRGSSPEEARVV